MSIMSRSLYGSYFFDGDDAYEEECLLQYFSNGFAQNYSRFHMLISNNSVFLVVLLNLYTNFIDEICDLIDC